MYCIYMGISYLGQAWMEKCSEWLSPEVEEGDQRLRTGNIYTVQGAKQ
jgi:hypothetical protein